jgi:ribosomal-protein-alanine N-acetyltransferase
MKNKISVKLRKFLLRDFQRIIEIEKSSFPIGAYSAKRIECLSRKYVNDFTVATLANNPVGYLLAYPKKTILVLDSIAVDRIYRKMGIAKKLIEFAIKKSKRKGLKKARLEVRINNKTAITFYKNFGFKIKKTIKKYYRDGCSAYQMEKVFN